MVAANGAEARRVVRGLHRFETEVELPLAFGFRIGRGSGQRVLGTFLGQVESFGPRIRRHHGCHVLDMASGVRRTDYVAVSNSVIGTVLLLAGTVGFLAPVVGSGGVLLILSGFGFVGAWWGRRLPEV